MTTDDSFSEDLNFNNPHFQFVAKDCTWQQRGIYLVCTSCELQHAVYIGTEKILTGFKDGKPILSPRQLM